MTPSKRCIESQVFEIDSTKEPSADEHSRWQKKTDKENVIFKITLHCLRNLVNALQYFFLELLKIGQIVFSSRPSKSDGARDQNTPVILIHGLFGNRDNWNRTCKDLESLGCDQLGQFYPISLSECNRSINDDLSIVIPWVKTIAEKHPSGRVHLIGHSRGGLIALLCAHALNLSDHSPVASVATIASPLKGCPLASWGHRRKLASSFKPLGDLALKSAVVEDIAKLFSKAHRGAKWVRTLHLVAMQDILVPPSSQAYSDENECLYLPTGHMGILFHPDAIKTLHKWICEPHTNF